jgi:hypothetical protein
MMSSGACIRKDYLGIDFALWKYEGSWFWLRINASGARSDEIAELANLQGIANDLRLSARSFSKGSS